MVLHIDEITRLFETHGKACYQGEAIDQLQHALQCAHLAERAGAAPELVAAALLHDLGHLLAAYAERLPDGSDDGHHYTAIPYLRGLFPDAVLEPIRLHVDAKRYLCAVDSAHWSRLSPTARRSLALQGGPFSASEATLFIRRPHADGAVLIRRWDENAKDPLARPPNWSHFVPVLHQVRLPQAQASTVRKGRSWLYA